MELKFDFYSTLLILVCVLLLGMFLIRKIKFLRDYNIPEPVVGGLIFALAFLALHQTIGANFSFDNDLKDPLMLSFYASVGLLADFSSFRKGGRRLVVFLIVISVLLVLQNIAGVAVAVALGENKLIGLLSGSITMSGGHGTGAAWAAEFVKPPYTFAPALEVAMASATFGLVAGGLVGGPVARYLIKKHNLRTPGENGDEGAGEPMTHFEEPQKERIITQISFIQSLALIAFCLWIGTEVARLMKVWFAGFTLPTFVYCLIVGILLRNSLSLTGIFKVFDREVSILGNVSLSLFLAFSLMTVNLWQLVSLALPLFLILLVQVVLMVVFAVFVTFRFCGGNYDAAVLSAGHCGFGLGATPTAMANMQAVTAHYGASHMAFIIVPLCGAFFIDIVNAFVINGFLGLF